MNNISFVFGERKEREKLTVFEGLVKYEQSTIKCFFSPTVNIEGLADMNNPGNARNAKVNAVVKRIKPSMRDKERYVAYVMVSQQPLRRDADRALVEKAQSLLGVFMAPKANLKSMKYNPEKQRGILRVNRKFMDQLRSCFAMIKNLNNQDVLIRTLRVSGMISKLKDKLE